ncbi:D-2-hydroxyacid dehydrogenase [Maribacter polysiphoniae]|uniref:D-2-hydroxyacid dehydrogenase n=1 Tax=Maribacter polysiphoniae TaxID=429344 RepID=A0A316E2A5_9FLAO|nr:D-2-hydroxyacid dehydrogenase [Maribacter polysiphoniae]MBD1260991.1 D-2-hydroxyacid dehydrogenase [Maribacter polysiphoniae]PWK23768.1 glycerate dehydrogenase [Maribacter polysiphoniae]
MKIVVLDGYTLNPGDLSWEKLEALGELTVYDRTEFSNEVIVDAIGNAEVIFTNKTPLPKEVLERTPSLKYIGVLATGYNVVDMQATKDLGITVTNVPTYGTTAVAQMTMALLLEICHHVGEHNRAVKQGEWTNSKDFSFWNYPLVELEGKTMGIIGFGRIGRATAKLAEAFGMNILASASRRRPELETTTCKYVDMDGLLTESDVISLHCPLTPDTEGIINAANIAKMKDGVMLINTARGQLVVEKDLKEALDHGKVAGAAIDVVSTEPIEADNPLLKAKNCIITPHIAWASKESRARLLNLAIDNLNAYLQGNPINKVN